MGTDHLGIPVVSSFYSLIKTWHQRQWSQEDNMNVIATVYYSDLDI